MVKKIVALAVMIIMMFSFAGCGGDEELKGLGSFEGLDPEIELQIIKTYFGDDYKGQESIDKSPIREYYGNFNDYIVVGLVPGWIWGSSPYPIMIGEVEFVCFERSIRIWKDNVFYSLEEAYDQSFLMIDDFEQIAACHKELYPEYYSLYYNEIAEKEYLDI